MNCDRGLIVVIVYYFQTGNKKEHNIISCRVIIGHIGPMYIETPYTLNYNNNFDLRNKSV